MKGGMHGFDSLKDQKKIIQFFNKENTKTEDLNN